MNILMLADSYKYSHSKQYPKDMVKMFDYLESRGGQYDKTVFFGLQYYIKKYLTKKITKEDVEEAFEFARLHGIPFDYEGWNYIVNKLNGKLPIKIKAVPEGSIIPNKNVLMTIESTDKNVPWVAGWIETLLLKIWYPITIATRSYYIRQMLSKYGTEEWVNFAFHNFGDRGSSSVEAAALGGLAHLTSFFGTDNFNSLKYAKKYYNDNCVGYSVFATEHSSTTSNAEGNSEKEYEFVLRMLKDNPKLPIMSFVADSYNVYEFTDFCTNPNKEIRQILNNREQKLVIRPDSGNPIEVLDKMFEILEKNNVFDIEIDGKKASSKYGILWGDGINNKSIEEILKYFTDKGYAAENFVFGSGGWLMQDLNRDTNKFAVKCSSITLKDDRQVDVFKDPITDKGKKSKKGEITLYYNDEKGYFTDRIGLNEQEMLEVVYENGEIKKEYSFEEIRKRVMNS